MKQWQYIGGSNMVELKRLNIDSREETDLYKYYVRQLYKSIKSDAEELGITDFDATYTDQDFWHRVRDKSRKFYWIIVNNSIVGIITIRDLGDVIKISNIFIEHSYRGYGYGSKAIKIIKEKYNKPLTLHVYYEGRAERLYKRLGFKPVYKELLLK